MHKLFDVWCRVVTYLDDLNHPAWHKDEAKGYSIGWAPLCPWVCYLADWLTGGRCHD